MRNILTDYFLNSKGIEFLGGFNDVQTFIQQSKYLAKPDVVLQAIKKDKESRTEAIFKVKSAFPKMDIIFFTMTDYPELIFNAICAGASGFIIKSSPLAEIRATIQMVYEGESQMTPSIARMVKAHFE